MPPPHATSLTCSTAPSSPSTFATPSPSPSTPSATTSTMPRSPLLPSSPRSHLMTAHLLRARRALSKLLPSDAATGLRTERSRSFNQRETSSRFLSWNMSRNCSAHIAAPRGGEGRTGELAVAVYTMSAMLVFAMWALGAALPCQERGGPPVVPSRQLLWAAMMVALQESFAEEWRRRDRKAAAGLLAELQEVERCGKVLMEVVVDASGSRVGGGGGCSSLERERVEEVPERAAELAEACWRLEEGLGPLERQVREAFHRVVGSRAEVLRNLDQSARPTTPSPTVP